MSDPQLMENADRNGSIATIPSDRNSKEREDYNEEERMIISKHGENVPAGLVDGCNPTEPLGQFGVRQFPSC
jgi:hypothetical protein